MNGRNGFRQYYVYIMASPSRTLYTGMTNDLERRVAEHRESLDGTFTARYHVNRLVYFEEFLTSKRQLSLKSRSRDYCERKRRRSRSSRL
ncbi:MAG: GIY-YIG nuclease family protein [Candidatus Binataceae bacterium]